MTDAQRDTLRHMLGLNYSKKSYRNYYACGKGDLEHLRQMEKEGLVEHYGGPCKDVPDYMFRATKKGIGLVLKPGETI